MKKVAIIGFIPVFLLVVFSMLPTGTPRDEVIEGYLSTTAMASSGTSYMQYMAQFSDAAAVDYDAEFAGEIGDRIAQFAAQLCEELGNGGSAKGESGRKAGQFRYSLNNVSGYYGTSEELRTNVQRMLSDTSHTSYISCCGFATFCWEVWLGGRSPYGTGCTSTVSGNFQDIIKGDGTEEYIQENAKPGDLIFYTNIQGTTPPIAVPGAGTYKHVEVYLGSYSGVDANGEAYEFDYACAGANLDTGKRDTYIKQLSNTMYGSRRAYLVSLEDWIKLGNDPVSNADEVEAMDEVLGGE